MTTKTQAHIETLNSITLSDDELDLFLELLSDAADDDAEAETLMNKLLDQFPEREEKK